MRKLLLLVISLVCLHAGAQEISDLRKLKLEKPEDYTAAKPQALMAADYILTNPYNRSDKNRVIAAAFLVKWMQKVPGYSFKFDATSERFQKEDPDLIAIYIAGLVRYAVMNPAVAMVFDIIKFEGTKLFLLYCKSPKNNVKLIGEVKKALDAEQKNMLAEYLQVDLTKTALATAPAQNNNIVAAALKDSNTNSTVTTDSVMLVESFDTAVISEQDFHTLSEELPEVSVLLRQNIMLTYVNTSSEVSTIKVVLVNYCGGAANKEWTSIPVKPGVNKVELPVSEELFPKGSSGVVKVTDGKKKYYLSVRRS